ncbi:MAG: type II toxin-antitoxin system RelE/ParE family toxin [Dehalococcoidia bacterium]
MIVQVSERAIDDLLEIVGRLADISPPGAAAFVDSYERILDQLRDFPLLGQASDREPEMRVMRSGPYRFLYWVSVDRVILSRIIDGRSQASLS